MSAEPGIGHNRPPEPLDAFAPRIDELVTAASERATVATETDAERATLLVAQLLDLARTIELERIDQKKPHLEAIRGIDDRYNRALLPIVGPDWKNRLGGAAGELRGRLDAWRKAKELERQAEARRLEQEAEAERKAAEAARTAKAKAEASDRAAQLEHQASERRAPVTVISGYGPRAMPRTVWRVEIADLSAALRHCLRIDLHRIKEAVQKIYDAQVRAGVRELPGASVIRDTQTTIRR